ncbi:MAG TPA: RluA family pseudouridine synthase, partial [Pyrinomonadaceae bacterium]|nr:RluA family pseudouridine synthase [Pyrinomonadaceae bacterium]
MNKQSNNEILQTFTVEKGDANQRLDAFLARQIENRSRSRIQKMIDSGDVLVNEKSSKSSYKVHANDIIEVELTELLAEKFEPENIPLDIVYEDEYLAVINKPAGMVVHPGAGVPSGTLANAIAYHFGFRSSDVGSNEKVVQNRVGIVHRL